MSSVREPSIAGEAALTVDGSRKAGVRSGAGAILQQGREALGDELSRAVAPPSGRIKRSHGAPADGAWSW